jgi:hypothetical protein
MVTADITLLNLISFFTEPPAVPEAKSTTPLYLRVPTHAAAEHGTFKKKKKSEVNQD